MPRKNKDYFFSVFSSAITDQSAIMNFHGERDYLLQTPSITYQLLYSKILRLQHNDGIKENHTFKSICFKAHNT